MARTHPLCSVCSRDSSLKAPPPLPPPLPLPPVVTGPSSVVRNPSTHLMLQLAKAGTGLPRQMVVPERQSVAVPGTMLLMPAEGRTPRSPQLWQKPSMTGGDQVQCSCASTTGCDGLHVCMETYASSLRSLRPGFHACAVELLALEMWYLQKPIEVRVACTWQGPSG